MYQNFLFFIDFLQVNTVYTIAHTHTQTHIFKEDKYYLQTEHVLFSGHLLSSSI